LFSHFFLIFNWKFWCGIQYLVSQNPKRMKELNHNYKFFFGLCHKMFKFFVHLQFVFLCAIEFEQFLHCVLYAIVNHHTMFRGWITQNKNLRESPQQFPLVYLYGKSSLLELLKPRSPKGCIFNPRVPLHI
jgi:hypothetical protein